MGRSVYNSMKIINDLLISREGEKIMDVFENEVVPITMDWSLT